MASDLKSRERMQTLFELPRTTLATITGGEPQGIIHLDGEPALGRRSQKPAGNPPPPPQQQPAPGGFGWLTDFLYPKPGPSGFGLF